MSDADHDEPDGYKGPAEITFDAKTVTVPVDLAGAFDPIAGKFRWHGRVRDLTNALDTAPDKGAELSIGTPHGDATAVVTHLDLWGSHMVDGISDPPFPVYED